MSDVGTLLIGFGVAFVCALGWVAIGLLMLGVSRADETERDSGKVED